jgi:hypothetical protein
MAEKDNPQPGQSEQQPPTHPNSPQEAQTVPVSPTKESNDNDDESKLYDLFKSHARDIKVILQMLVGGILALLIILKFIHHFFVLHLLIGQVTGFWSYPIAFLHTFVYSVPTLDIVAFALAYAAAFELAYTLFTPGPDEAVEPLITGLAAVILFLISRISTVTFNNAGGITLLVVALIGLFVLRFYFIQEKTGLPFLRNKTADK